MRGFCISLKKKANQNETVLSGNYCQNITKNQIRNGYLRMDDI
jgi:hypothetical protein